MILTHFGLEEGNLGGNQSSHISNGHPRVRRLLGVDVTPRGKCPHPGNWGRMAGRWEKWPEMGFSGHSPIFGHLPPIPRWAIFRQLFVPTSEARNGFVPGQRDLVPFKLFHPQTVTELSQSLAMLPYIQNR